MYKISSVLRDQIRIKATIVFYKVKILFGTAGRNKKEEKGATTEVQRTKKKKKKNPHVLMHNFKIN